MVLQRETRRRRRTPTQLPPTHLHGQLLCAPFVLLVLASLGGDALWLLRVHPQSLRRCDHTRFRPRGGKVIWSKRRGARRAGAGIPPRIRQCGCSQTRRARQEGTAQKPPLDLHRDLERERQDQQRAHCRDEPISAEGGSAILARSGEGAVQARTAHRTSNARFISAAQLCNRPQIGRTRPVKLESSQSAVKLTWPLQNLNPASSSGFGITSCHCGRIDLDEEAAEAAAAAAPRARRAAAAAALGPRAAAAPPRPPPAGAGAGACTAN